jgi:phosphate transport system substrate-binding protein
VKTPKIILSLLSALAVWSSTLVAWPQTPQQQPGPASSIAAGSGVNLGITRILAKAFMTAHPSIIIEVPGSVGTKGAIAAVADGAIALGLLSRPLKDEEKAPGLVARPYARTPMVVGVHSTVPEEEITSQELVDIYRGTKTRWKDGNEIIVQTREPFDSGIQVLQKEIPGFKQAYEESHQANRWTVYFTDQDANQALSSTPSAIGFTDLGMIATEHLNIKALRLNGVAPSPETLNSDRYPLSRVLYFLYRDGTLPEVAKAFLDFVCSEEGATILKSNGYLPEN